MKKKLNCSILIVTHNRPQQLLRCVQSILKLEAIPSEILIAYSSFTDINEVRSLKGIRFFLSENSIPVKRNLLISNARQDICIFIDDDVCLAMQKLSSILNIYEKNKQIAIIGGICFPIKKNIISQYIFNIFYQRYIFKKSKFINTDFCPTMLFSFKKSLLIKNNIFFDEQFLALEDIDLCYQTTSKGYLIFIYKDFFGFHEYRITLKAFISSFNNYFKYINLLFDKHKIDTFMVKKYKEKKFVQFIIYFFSNVLKKRNMTKFVFYNIILSFIYELLLVKNIKTMS